MKKITEAIADLRFSGLIFLIACLSILTIYVPLTISANTDLAVGRFALFMDERITFDGVKRIIHPTSVVQFFDSVLDGGDHRYGRSLWNAIAIFSVIPERLYGDSGLIIAARMLQVILIIASYCIFAFGILRSWFLRFVLLVAILTIPFSDYFMTMPKPEPLQLLFLAIFTYFFVKKNAAFSWYWIFIGLAFGTKISTLPALLVFIVVALIARSKNDLSSVCRKSLTRTVIWFFLGLAIAVPILFLPLLLSICGYLAFDWLKKFFLGRVSRITIAVALIVAVFLASLKVLKVWISSTFLNTAHGADQASINALSWMDYFFDKWLIAPYAIGLLLFMFIFGYFILYIVQIFKSEFNSIDQRTTVFAIAIAGLALNIAIIVGAKRLWGFYLYPGTVLMVAGITMLADLCISDSLNKNNMHSMVMTKTLSYFIAIFLLVVSTLYWMPRAIDGLEGASLRTKTPEYTLQYSSYKAITVFLNNYKVAEGRRLHVRFSPSLFTLESNEKYEIIEFWGPYVNWDEAVDIIIFSAANTPKGKPYPEDSPEYSKFLVERGGYLRHVAEKGSACPNVPCFTKEFELPNGGEVLILKQPMVGPIRP